MTRRGGRIPLRPSPPFDRFTRLVMDVKLGHVFATDTHAPKPSSIRDMEQAKRGKYTDLYRDRGFAFAPLVINSWGVFGPDLLRFLWAIADHAARNAMSLPLDRLSSSLSQPPPSQPDELSEERLLSFKILRGRLNLDYRLRLLSTVYEAFTERVFGRTHALASLPEYLHFQAAARAVWLPTNFSIPAPSPPPPPPLHSSSSAASAPLSSSEVSLTPSSSFAPVDGSRASLPGPPSSAPPDVATLVAAARPFVEDLFHSLLPSSLN